MKSCFHILLTPAQTSSEVAHSFYSEEDRKVLTLNEPQVWVVIGVFASALFGMFGFVTTSLTRTIRTELNAVRSELGSEISSLRQEMNVRFDSLSSRIDHLDRDVQFLMKRELEDRS